MDAPFLLATHMTGTKFPQDSESEGLLVSTCFPFLYTTSSGFVVTLNYNDSFFSTVSVFYDALAHLIT